MTTPPSDPFYDYLKHLTTLNTGAIVAIAAFSGNILEQPHWKALAGVAVSGFIISIVGCGLANFVLAVKARGGHLPVTQGSEESVVSVTFYVATGSFLIALICLGVFGTRNFY